MLSEIYFVPQKLNNDERKQNKTFFTISLLENLLNHEN